MTEFWKKHLADTITIAFFAIAGVALAIYAALPKNGTYDSLKAEITLDGKRLEKNGYLDLSSYGEEETEIEIIGKKSPMKIGVKHNAIHVLSSDCPSHYCISQGWVTEPGVPIVCAYNHIVITILGTSGNDINL